MDSSMIRELPLKGAYNVRDLGGYLTANGKTVKWKTIFRSGDLNNLTEQDLKYLEAIPLKITIDFRDAEEIKRAPDRKPASLEKQYFLPIETGNVIEFQKISPELAPTLLVEANKFIVRNSQETYKKFFEILMDEKATPLLFHCSAGKDRAGLGAALFLSSLGVDREIIIKDYLLTNDYLRDKYASIIDFMPMLAPLMQAKKEYIQAAFDTIDNEFGGMDNYLISNLDVDLEKMKFLYTN